jgi:group I intron endonuclease
MTPTEYALWAERRRQKRFIIYLGVNTLNGKMYVGQTTQAFKSRIYDHKQLAKRSPRCSPFCRAIYEYGIGNFKFVVVSIKKLRTEADEMEKRLIQILGTKIPNGYNTRDGGGSDPNGMSSNIARNWVRACHKWTPVL